LLSAAELAVKIVGKGNIELKERDSDFPSRGALDITQAKEHLNFSPKIDIDEGFQKYYEWLSSSPFWQDKLK
jgi:nucleoside-diphosphate-sugar epimerase